MADDADRAEGLIERTRDAAIAGVCAVALALAQPSGCRVCRQCGEPIAVGRSLAVPAAEHCVRCAKDGHP